MSEVIVILRMPGGPVPLHDQDNNVCVFESASAAREAIDGNRVVEAYGATIIDLDEDGELL